MPNAAPIRPVPRALPLTKVNANGRAMLALLDATKHAANNRTHRTEQCPTCGADRVACATCHPTTGRLSPCLCS